MPQLLPSLSDALVTSFPGNYRRIPQLSVADGRWNKWLWQRSGTALYSDEDDLGATNEACRDFDIGLAEEKSCTVPKTDIVRVLCSFTALFCTVREALLRGFFFSTLLNNIIKHTGYQRSTLRWTFRRPFTCATVYERERVVFLAWDVTRCSYISVPLL